VSIRGLGIGGLALVVSLVLGSGSASARIGHAFSLSFGAAGSEAGEVSLAAGGGVAVSSVTHDVYVADTGNARVDEFTSAGVFVRAWGWGVADGLPAFEACTLTCQAGMLGAEPGEFTTPVFVAVDNSGGASAGDVYVGDTGTNTVSKFSETGAYISTNDGSSASAPVAGPFGPLAGITVDGSGDLWVYGASGSMFEFAQDGSFVTDWSSGLEGYPPAGIDADSTGNLYVDYYGSVEQLTAGGTFVGAVNGDAFEPTGFAVDRSRDEVYMDNGGGLIRHYEAACDAGGNCAALDTFGAGLLSGAAGLAVDSSDATVYAVDTGDARIDAFASFVLPDVLTGQASGLTTTTATLQGTVNPNSTTLTDCHFAYVAEALYNPSEPDPYAAGQTVPCASLPVGSSPEPVSADVSGLTPSTVYHFRLSAANSNGAVTGVDGTFATGPGIVSTSAANLTASAADLRAQIEPRGLDTTYHFEYGTSVAYGQRTLESVSIGSDAQVHSVSAHIQGLAAGTTYHYRVVASNATAPGGIPGPDRTFTTPASAGGTPGLPDGRAYELVSPADKNGGAVDGDQVHVYSFFASFQSSADGSEMAFPSQEVFADAQSGTGQFKFYIASRASGGWSTHSLLPPQAPGCNTCAPYIQAYSADLSKAALLIGGGGFGQDDPLLVAGEPQSKEPNLFVRDNRSDSYRLVDVTPASVTPARPEIMGASADLSHVVFSENAQLTPNGPGVYEWAGGVVRVLGELPGGAVAGEVALDAISEDGARVVFTAGGNLYVREDGVRAVQVDASQGPGGGGGGQFGAASSDGSKVFFTDDASAGLTNDTVPGSGANLYEYDVPSGRLTDLTPASHVEAQGLLGAGSDGSYLYLYAAGDLAAGATAGQSNLYVLHGGTITFIVSNPGVYRYRIPPDGAYLAFVSTSSLTGYDNTDANTGQADGEIFLYDAVSRVLRCASCNPTGERPVGSSLLVGSSLGEEEEDEIARVRRGRVVSRNLSEDGRLFFNSSDVLLPGASNGRVNVYEYEGGRLYLISTGASSEDSFFEDASVSGSDVFLLTSQPLVPQDVDSSYDIYDARVGGGFPAQQTPAPCEGEGCRPVSPPVSSGPAAASMGFVGAGNLVPGVAAVLGRVRLLRETVSGATVRLTVSVPGGGRVTISGVGLRTVSREVAGAGTYTLTVVLGGRAPRGRRPVVHRRRRRLTIRVGYAPVVGAASSATVKLTVKA
jgi:hypothetical protein